MNPTPVDPNVSRGMGQKITDPTVGRDPTVGHDPTVAYHGPTPIRQGDSTHREKTLDSQNADHATMLRLIAQLKARVDELEGYTADLESTIQSLLDQSRNAVDRAYETAGVPLPADGPITTS